MSLDLGSPHWKLVGVVDGSALFTQWSEQRSRWVDVNEWPGKLEVAREEWTRAVCPGASLVGWKQQKIYLDKRKPLELPTKKHGYRAIGMLDKRVVVVPGHLGMDNKSSPLTCATTPMIYDGTSWKKLDGQGGLDTPHAAVVPLDDGRALVVWGGRVLVFDGALSTTEAGDLPRTHPNFDPGHVATGDGFITVGGGKLVTISDAGNKREETRIGKLELVSVLRHDDRLIVFDGRSHYFDDGTRVDFGSSLEHPATLVAAPCGLVALVKDDRVLVRVRV